MAYEQEPLIFIKHPDEVAGSYEQTVHEFMGLIISAENEDPILTPYSHAEIDAIKQAAPERYERVLRAAELALSRGFPEQGPRIADPAVAAIPPQRLAEETSLRQAA